MSHGRRSVFEYRMVVSGRTQPGGTGARPIQRAVMRTSTLRLILAALLLALTSIALPRAAQPQPGKVYLFTSFRGNGEDGLHLAYSHDGLRWTDLGRSFLKPAVGI